MAEALLPPDLPDGRALVAEGKRLGADVRVGRSLLCEAHDVRSEVAYRRKMHASGRLMTCMNIGLSSWDDTARALEAIYAACEQRGFRIDRYQLNLDRRMGLPPALWDAAPKETGPMLETPEHWLATTRTVPIQPHLGDMMIGSPMSVDNARRALEAGVTYIGNLSQFSWRYPVWTGDDVAQVAETVKALGLMASKRDDDAMLHSYLDDGFAARFKDYCSYVGWALVERHAVEELTGARVAIAYGGLTHAPLTKAAMVLALEAVTPPGTSNSFYHGNTTAYRERTDDNFAMLSVDVLYVMLAQLRADSDAPTLPIPVTEALRIPSWEEIVQAHTIARRIADLAPALVDTIDWTRIEALRDRLVDGGRRFAANVLGGLEELGVDLEDPLQVLLALRRLGPAAIEDRFGVGELPRRAGDTYEPLIPTDTFSDFLDERRRIRSYLASASTSGERTLVVGSSDVHEFALLLVVDALRTLGVEPVVAGISVDPGELAQLAAAHRADAVLVSTHNGMALTYARALRRALQAHGVDPLIAMGGTLNEDLDGHATPVELSRELAQLGVRVCTDVTDVLALVSAEGG